MACECWPGDNATRPQERWQLSLGCCMWSPCSLGPTLICNGQIDCSYESNHFLTSSLVVLRMVWFIRVVRSVYILTVFSLHFINPLATSVESEWKLALFYWLMLTSKPEFTGRTALACPFFSLFWTLLIYPVKAARMCLRSAHYCKIKRSWLDRALPRKTQNLLIKKRFPADWSQQYSRCPSSHWIQA